MKADTFRIDGNEKGWAGLHNPARRWNGWAHEVREALKGVK